MNRSKIGSSIFRCFLSLILLAGGFQLFGQSAPTATTGSASGIDQTFATLNGTVNANGSSTTVTFEYGLDNSYGSSVDALQSPVSGTSATAVSVEIYELSTNTTYHYRVVAQSTNGTTYGSDMTFTTLAELPTAVSAAATNITGGGAQLNGNVNPNGFSTDVSFEYGTDTNYGTTVPSLLTPVTNSSIALAQITGLLANTTYFFRIKVVNSAGTNYSDPLSFATDAIPPTATTDAATAVGSVTATVNGTVNAKGTPTTVTFEYGPDTNYGSTILASQGVISGNSDTPVDAVLTDVDPNTTYHYRITAVNSAGTVNSTDMTFTTLPLPPAVTTGLANPVGETSATLNGTVNANDGSTVVSFEYGLDASYGTEVTADQSPLSGSTATPVSKALTSLINNATYHYRVKAVNAGGTSYGADMTFFTGIAPPTTNTDAATNLGTNSATLNGSVNANNGETSVQFQYGTTTSYGRTVNASPSTISGSTATAVSVTPTDLASNTLYHFRVVATNVGGTTYGADMTFTTRSVPTVSTNAASGVDTTNATLNGTVDANNDSATVTFEYGTTTAYGNTVTADQSPVTGDVATPVSKSLSGLTANTTYHYRVVAVNANGTSYGSDMTFFTAVQAAPTVTTSAAIALTDSATLQGLVNANNATTTVTFEYGTTTAYGTVVTAAQSPVTGAVDTFVSAAISGLSNNTTYHYRVLGTNSIGSDTGADMTFNTSFKPTATTNAATNVGGATATLNGTVNANGVTTTVTFEYGTTTSYGSSVSAGNLFDNADTPVSAPLSGLSNNTTYHFRVKAQSAGGTTYGSDLTFTTSASPTAVTNAATSITASGVTFNGTVNANNNTVAVIFEYGLNTSYGLTTPAAQSPVSGNANTAVSRSIVTLSPNKTYHYRVVASTTTETIYGADVSFTTPGLAPTATTSAATAVTSTGATLNGSVNAKNDSTTVTFEYGTTTAYGSSTAASPGTVTGATTTAVTAVLSGLTSGTTYHFRVKAVNSAGTSYGVDQTFFTDASAPTAVTTAATNVQPTSATLNGTVNANNNSTTVSFEWGPSTSYGRTSAATPGTVTGSANTAVSAALTNLTPNTTYHYRVKAVSSSGTTYGADMSFLSGSASPDAVTAAATAVTGTTASLNGTVNANYLSTTVEFEYGTTAAYGTTVTADQSPVTGSANTPVSAALTGLQPNTTYHYRVKADNSAGSDNGADMTFTTSTVPPDATTNAATSVTFDSTTLNGTVNANNDSTTVTFEYGTSVAYGSTVTADQSPVTGSTNTTVSAGLTGLTHSTTYHYRVKAVNSAGTEYGADMTFTTSNGLPEATTNAATAVSSTNATLNGSVVANSSSTDVTFEYGLDNTYGTVVTADQSPISGTTATAVTATLSGLTPNTTYHYRVAGQNSNGTDKGANMTFTTSASGPTVTTDAATNVDIESATLNGTVNANNDSTTVTFEYGTDMTYGTTVAAVPSPVTGTTDTAVSAAITGLTGNTTYHFRVVGQNSSGTENGADQTFTTLTVQVPTVTTTPVTKVTTKSAKTGGNVTDQGGSAVTDRGVCWSTSPNPTIADSKNSEGSGTGAFDSKIKNLDEATTYYVRAYATNSFGTGYGEEFSFTTNNKSLSITIIQPKNNQVVAGEIKVQATAKSTSAGHFSQGKKKASISKVEFYIDNAKVAEFTSTPYKYDWDTTTYSDGEYLIKAVVYNSDNESSQDIISVTVANSGQPDGGAISVSRNHLNFTAIPFGRRGYLFTLPQLLYIKNLSQSKVEWTITSDVSWLKTLPSSGKGSRLFLAIAKPNGMQPGTYNASLTISETGSSVVLEEITVQLTVREKGFSPFGALSSPHNGIKGSNVIPVTGWALDDLQVSNVKIYREPLKGEGNQLIFLGDAFMLDDAQPAQEIAHAGYPLNYRAGWGYLLMTHLLPNQGNGTFTIVAQATDIEDNTVTLGSTTITVDNANGLKPFGFLDPIITDKVTGTALSSGWAMVPQPGIIPANGSTISFWLDGVNIGSPVYNQYENDAASLFPGLSNSQGAGASLNLDTTALRSGNHTVTWTISDEAGNSHNIGTRYFSIEKEIEPESSVLMGKVIKTFGQLQQLPQTLQPGAVKRGFNAAPEALFTDENGIGTVTLKELDKLDLHISGNIQASWGYLVVGDSLRPLPVGSTLNQLTGQFTWLGAPGQQGSYLMAFVIKDTEGQYTRKFVRVIFEPLFTK